MKIGVATDCASRLSALQVGCPLPLALLWSQAALNALAVEEALHERFAAQRVQGEWFDLGVDPVPIVKDALAGISPHLDEIDEQLRMAARELAATVRAEALEVLAAVREVWPDGTTKIGTHQLTSLLTAHRSGKYADWSSPELNARMREAGVAPHPLRVNGKVIRGYERVNVYADQA